MYLVERYRKKLGELVLELSAKRRVRQAPIDSWYPYYAGFSYAFAVRLLSLAKQAPDTLVLDPWNGSGTTTAAAFHLGMKSYGFDLNPATIPIARSKQASSADLEELENALTVCLTKARKLTDLTPRPGAEDTLRDWLPPKSAKFLRDALGLVRQGAHSGPLLDLSPAEALLATSLLGGVRPFAVDPFKSNRTWSQPRNIRRIRISELCDNVLRHSASIVDDQELCPNSHKNMAQCDLGDSRSLPIGNEVVDIVLTSPPYCTRIDYARQMQFEAESLRVADAFDPRTLRESLMGTTTIRRLDPGLGESLPSMTKSLLDQIASHPSHRSANYYQSNFRQYFEDAMKSVTEIGRVLKPGGVAFLIVQNSYYKEIEIDLGKQFGAMARSAGLTARRVGRHSVLNPLGGINAGSKAYASGRKYSEDLMLLHKQ